MPTPTNPLPPGSGDIARVIAGSVTDYASAVEVLRGQIAHDWTDVIPHDMRDMYEHCWAAAFVDCVMQLAAPAPLPTGPGDFEDMRVIDALVGELREAESAADRIAEEQHAALMPPNHYDQTYLDTARFYRKLAYRYHQLIEEITATSLFDRLDAEDAADLALVQARATADNGNRTPLAAVLAEHGLTAGDLEVDAHSCNNCSGIDPDTCLFNGEKES